METKYYLAFEHDPFSRWQELTGITSDEDILQKDIRAKIKAMYMKGDRQQLGNETPKVCVYRVTKEVLLRYQMEITEYE